MCVCVCMCACMRACTCVDVWCMYTCLHDLLMFQVLRGTKTVESIFQGSYVRFQFNGSQNTST